MSSRFSSNETPRGRIGPGAFFVLWVMLAILAACTGDSPSASEPDPALRTPASSGAESPPAIVTPYLPIPLERASPGFQRVVRAFDAVKDHALPSPPASSDDGTLSEWRESALVPWLRDRIEAIATLRTELRALRAGDRDEYLVACALLGALLDGTATELNATEISPDPSSPEHVVAVAPPERIEALREGARRAFDRCVGAGLGGIELAAWRAFCADAQSRLGVPTETEASEPDRVDGPVLGEE